jgi:hypothetical protein
MRYGAGVPTVFPNFVQLIAGRPGPETDAPFFIEAVEVQQREPRRPHVERLIGWCWALIAGKHIAVAWAVWHYHLPFHQLWINFPTWLLGVLATAIYYGRTRRV